MQIKIAKSLGFCFGVQRAIDIAENYKGSKTLGPLIHNKAEINRLSTEFKVDVIEDLSSINNSDNIVIRTHGIPKKQKLDLQSKGVNLIDATCPFVTKLQNLVEKMSALCYDVVIFGDKMHPEIQGVVSYGNKNTYVVNSLSELKKLTLKEKVAIVSQTTRRPNDFLNLVNFLILHQKEVRIFNTICNATFQNQEAAKELAKEADVMIVIGGKHSSNTKQLLNICLKRCSDSFLVETSDDLKAEWFKNKNICGISAGASTPKWMIEEVIISIKNLSLHKEK